jgi:Tfp pilus assembly pilus retraction ATPase PilT
MFANPAVRNNIRSGKVEAIYQTMQTSAAEGMQTMDQSLIKLCREGQVDYETVKPFIYERTTHDTIKASAGAGAARYGGNGRPAGAH